jgi:glycosyltransferase involved in cell wall biosynthesis
MPEVAGDATLLVDPYSIDEISIAMKRVRDSDMLCKTLISKGLDRVREYSWDISIERHLEIFKKII